MPSPDVLNQTIINGRIKMFRSVILWMLGIPIPIIILLWLFLR
ncbi:hypothetical protein [Aminobacter sp. LjRoot7]